MTTQEILILFQDYFSIKQIFNVPFTYVGELFLRLSYSLAVVSENVVSQVYRISDFYSTGEVGNFYNIILAVSWGFLAIVVAWIGIKKISGIPVPNQTIFRNIVLALLFVIILPDMMTKFDELATIGKQGASEISSDESDSDSIAMLAISDNVTDLLILDSNNFEGTASDSYGLNNITEDNFQYIDFQESIEIGREGLDNPDVFKNRITVTEDGDTQMDKLESGWLSWDQNYYRYSVDYVTVIIQLLIISVVYIFFAFKIVQISFELAVTKIISPIIIFTDIGTGQKVKQIFREVVNGFATLAIIFFLLRLYQIMVTWISTPNVIVSGEMEPLLKALVLLILGLVVIDGTSVITRVLGFDVGVKDGFRTMAGMYAGAKGFSAATKGAVSSVGNGVSGIDSQMKKSKKKKEDKEKKAKAKELGTQGESMKSSINPTADKKSNVGINEGTGNSAFENKDEKTRNGVSKSEEISSMDNESSINQNPVESQQQDLDTDKPKEETETENSLNSSSSPITGQQYNLNSNNPNGTNKTNSSSESDTNTGDTSSKQSDGIMSSSKEIEQPQTNDSHGTNGKDSEIPLSGQQSNVNLNERKSMNEQQNGITKTAINQQGINQPTTGNIATGNQSQSSQGSTASTASTASTTESRSGIGNASDSSTSSSTTSNSGTNSGSYKEKNQEYFSSSISTDNKVNETMKEFSSNISSQHSKPKNIKRPSLQKNTFKSE